MCHALILLKFAQELARFLGSWLGSMTCLDSKALPRSQSGGPASSSWWQPCRMEAGHNVWVCAPMVLAEYQLWSWVQKQNSGQWQCAILSWSFWAILRTQRAPRNAVEDKWTDGLQAGACGEKSTRWCCIKLRDIPKWPDSLENHGKFEKNLGNNFVNL